MYTTQQSPLPVSFTNWDMATFNNNLPNGNDVWPALQFPPQFNEVASYVVSNFRKLAQDRCGRTPLHTFAYNLLSANRFNNEAMQKWCQLAVDFAQFLMIAQQNSPGDAVMKAATKIYVSFVAMMSQQFPAIMDQVDMNTRNNLPGAIQELNNIVQDVTTFKSQRAGGAPGYGGQVNNGYTTGQAAQSIQSTLHSVISANAPQPIGHVSNNAQAAPAGRTSGMLLDSAPAQSWTAGQPLNTGSSVPQQGASVMHQETLSDVTETYPQTIDDLVIDPNHWIPRGFVVDKLRPYDEIHNAGGVEIRPAYLASKLSNKAQWKWTAGDDQPYRVTYDPQQYILFLAKWPDGRVKEVVVAAKPEMEYLLHEINDELRGKAIKPKGLVVARTDGIIDGDAKPVPLSELAHELDGHLPTESQLKPVLIERVFAGNTDRENEVEARNEIRGILGLDADAALPAHEYQSYWFHPLEITAETYATCMLFKDYKSFDAVATMLQLMLDRNELSIRVFRFIDRRLTDAINTYLADSLSITSVTIDSFTSDVQDLSPYLAKKKGEAFQAAFDDSVTTVLGRYLTFGEMEDELDGDTEGAKAVTYGLLDQYVNFQVGWTQLDLESLEVTKEAKLLSNYTHPRITNVVAGMLKRASEQGTLRCSRLRVVTDDGVYYEVIRGKLLDKATLLKRL